METAGNLIAGLLSLLGAAGVFWLTREDKHTPQPRTLTFFVFSAIQWVCIIGMVGAGIYSIALAFTT